MIHIVHVLCYGNNCCVTEENVRLSMLRWTIRYFIIIIYYLA